jgi:hypothetical protein
MALGIGATTAVFSVIYAVLIDPFPYPGSERMAELRLIDGGGRERGVGLPVRRPGSFGNQVD